MPKRKKKDEEEQVPIVTRIARTRKHTNSKHRRLLEMGEECGKIRTEAWRRYGSIGAIGRTPRTIRDEDWMNGIELASAIPLQARLWKATLQDSLDDIKAYKASAVNEAIKDVYRRNDGDEVRKRRTKALNNGSWVKDKLLCRLMRKNWKHGENHCFNQIVLDPQCYKTFQRAGQAWIKVSSIIPRQRIAIPLGKYDTSKISGNIRLILRDDETIEIHHTLDAKEACETRPCEKQAVIGVDMGYTEVLTDNLGNRYGEGFGELMTANTERRKVLYEKRGKLHELARKAEQKGNHAKARRIRENNLGRKKENRKKHSFKQQLRTKIFTAVHEALDTANSIVYEDLRKNIQRDLGRNSNRRLSAWTKGVIREALESIPKRRGASSFPVNAAYTSQWIRCNVCGSEDFGTRRGDEIHCKHCRAVHVSDQKSAENVLDRKNDPEITLKTFYTKVKSILAGRVCIRNKNTVGTASTKTPATTGPTTGDRAESESIDYKCSRVTLFSVAEGRDFVLQRPHARSDSAAEK